MSSDNRNHFYFLELHNEITHTKCLVNLTNVTAISNDSDCVMVYLVGNGAIRVDETYEQITDIMSAMFQDK